MICYRDRAYCSASVTRCKNETCYRFLSKMEKQRAEELELPIAYSDFWVECKDMVEVEVGRE